MDRKYRYTFVTILFIVIMLVGAACSSNTATPTATTAPVSAAATNTSAPVAGATDTSAPVAAATNTSAPVAAAATATTASGTAAPVKDVPRAQTFVVTLWSDTAGSIPSFDNWNPLMNWANAMRGNGGNLGMGEGLYYRNLNDGTETPWLATDYSHNTDFSEWTMHLRKGVTWSDGVAFTCADVKYTIDTTIAGAPAMNQSSYFKQWVKTTTCSDDFTLVIDLTAPFSRFMYPLVIGQEYHFTIVPQHIFKDAGDLTKFTNFDLAKGWPVFTGPYKVVSVSAQQIVLDERDSWWAVQTGFFPNMPAPKRIIVIPFGSDEAMAEKYITNQIDYGGPLLIGTYLAAVQKNAKLVPWFKTGDVRGAPDGCMYDLQLNNNNPLFKDVNVRLALNYATDRAKIVSLAYLNSNHAAVVPFSDYISNWVTGDLKTAIDSYDRGTPSSDKVASYMKAAGFTMNSSKLWAKADGSTAKFTIITPSWLAPIGPVLTQQYTDAGFDVTEAPDRTNAFSDELTAGNFDAMVYVFCNSLNEPYDTLQYFDSSFNTPAGTAAVNAMAGWRYSNPAMDKELTAMQNMIPDKSDPAYMQHVIAATKIYLEDMPTIILAVELHVIPGNYTYWTGYPNSDDPYVAPFPCWKDIFLMTLKLKPVTQ
jgi:peptide/nickel transport system substrate-binding protein